MLQLVPFFSCCSFRNNCRMLSCQEGQHTGTKEKNFACSTMVETLLTVSAFAYWLFHRTVLSSSSVCLLFYPKTLQSCRTTIKREQDSVFLASVSLAFMENCSSSGSRLTWHTNCHPSLNQDAYKHYIWIYRLSNGALVEHLWLPQACDACIMVAKYFKDCGPVL